MHFATGSCVINDSRQAETCRGSFLHTSVVSLPEVAVIRSMKQLFSLIFVWFALMSLMFAKTILKFIILSSIVFPQSKNTHIT